VQVLKPLVAARGGTVSVLSYGETEEPDISFSLPPIGLTEEEEHHVGDSFREAVKRVLQSKYPGLFCPIDISTQFSHGAAASFHIDWK
jgi:hypothetical protein